MPAPQEEQQLFLSSQAYQGCPWHLLPTKVKSTALPEPWKLSLWYGILLESSGSHGDSWPPHPPSLTSVVLFVLGKPR